LLLLLLAATSLSSCKNGSEEKKTEETATASTGTPVTVTTINTDPLTEYIELNATSTFLQKSYVKANVNGYVQTANTQPGKYVTAGQVLFVIKTKEAQNIGNAVNNIDPSFRFSGVNNIKANTTGYITQLNHQVGDYVQDGEQLAVISDASSFAFLLNLPFELRSYLNNKKTVELLLDRGADLHVEEDEGPDSPLQLACIYGHTDTVKLLLDRGADIHAADAFATAEGPLLFASEFGHVKTVRLLLDNGANIHAADYMGPGAPLRRAASNGYFRTVKLLLDRGADISESDNHMLRAAAELGSVSTVRLLLKIGKFRQTNPELALVVSATVGCLRDVESLLREPIDDLAVDLALRRGAAKGHSNLVAMLLDYGASIRENDDEALHAAAMYGHTATVSLLLSRYQNSDLLTIRGDIKEGNLLHAVQGELLRRQIVVLRQLYRNLPTMEI